jgi:thymidylate kinase
MIRITVSILIKPMILLQIRRRNEEECNTEHLTDFAIAYFTKLKEKYEKVAKSNQMNFDDIEATK